MHAPGELRALLKTSLPIMLGHVGSVAVGLTDSIMLGRLGANELGAVGLAVSFYTAIATVGWGLLFPVLILSSQAIGKAQSHTVPRITRQGLWLAGLISVPICMILWHLEGLFLLMKQDDQLVQLATLYMDYYLWTTFPVLGSLVLAYALTATKRTKMIAYVSWGKVILNAALNYVLIFGKLGIPAMGLEGAGLASIMVQCIGYAILFISLSFYTSFRKKRLFLLTWKPHPGIIRKLVSLGWAKSVEMTMKNVLYFAFASLAARLGVHAIAAHTIAFQVYLTFNGIVSFAVASAVTTHVGMAIAKGWTTIRSVLTQGIGLFFLFIVPLATFFWSSPRYIVMLFTGAMPATVSPFSIAATRLIPVMVFFLVADGLRTIASQALSGVSDIKIPALWTTLAYWIIALPAGFVFAFSLNGGITGLWWGMALGISIATLLLIRRFWKITYHF